MYEQERPAVPVAQEQTFSFAYGRGRKAVIHLQAQGEHIHKDLQLLCAFSGNLHPRIFSAQVLLHSWGLTDCGFYAEFIPIGNFFFNFFFFDVFPDESLTLSGFFSPPPAVLSIGIE